MSRQKYFFFPLATSFSSVAIFRHLMNKKWSKLPLFILPTLWQEKEKKNKCERCSFSRLFQLETRTDKRLLKAVQLQESQVILGFRLVRLISHSITQTDVDHYHGSLSQYQCFRALTRDSKDLCDPDFKEPKDSQSVQSFFESLSHSLVGATDTGVPWWAEPFQGTRYSTFLSAAEDSLCFFVCCLFFFCFFFNTSRNSSCVFLRVENLTDVPGASGHRAHGAPVACPLSLPLFF